MHGRADLVVGLGTRGLFRSVAMVQVAQFDFESFFSESKRTF